jgi:predicted dehydrogenase
MKNIDRRLFIKRSGAASAGTLVGSRLMGRTFTKNSPNDTVRVAVIGIRNRGMDHCRALAQIPNVTIATLCDIDQRLLPGAVAEVEKLTGHRPDTTTQYRKVLEDPNIDAVTIATPNHWHALQTIWACQAGKDVYVEKPVSHTILEGRRMVEAARKYRRIVQTGTQSRSNPATLRAIDYMNAGGLGNIYMVKGLCLKPRASIGRTGNSEIPEGVDWDTFLGPAPYRPFNENRFHYKWHWFWDTGNGDFGNQGIHQADIGRWVLNMVSHPVKIQGFGNYFVWDSDQETPNIQHLEFEYGDGRILQFEVRGLGTNEEGGIRIGNLAFGSKGWMKMTNEEEGKCQSYLTEIQLNPSGFSSYREESGPVFTNDDPATSDAVVNHFTNFINCVRNRKWEDLNADILEGHLSTSLCHLGNIACRLKRPLHFDPATETFLGDPEADGYLSKEYRSPNVLPDVV